MAGYVGSAGPDLGALGQQVPGELCTAEGMVVEEYSTWKLVYRDERRVVELGYDPEELPRPMLSVVVGVREPGAGVLRLPLWRIYPEVAEFADGTTFKFDSEASLRERVIMVRDRWWQRYVLGAFADLPRLRTALLAERDEAERRYEGHVAHQRLIQARAAADRGDHRAALDLYALLGQQGLAAQDRKRILRARRGLG